jgi:hypothetical protein
MNAESLCTFVRVEERGDPEFRGDVIDGKHKGDVSSGVSSLYRFVRKEGRGRLDEQRAG